jgi:hypothetical protein
MANSMKSFTFKNGILNLVGISLISTFWMPIKLANAMPESDALKRLEPIPVFTLTNAQGIPILGSITDPKNKGKKIQIATFFMSQEDAQSLLTKIKVQKPELGKDAKILSLSMRQAYAIKAKNKAKADTLLFEFLPPKQQVEAAISVLNQNGKNVKNFPDIPLFFAIGGSDKGLLTILL